MVGVLASQGIRASSQRIGQSLARVNPAYHSRRKNRTERQINPIPYSSKYFGNKVHIDQNEKLVLFGVTHVCAIDGYSGMIVGFITIPLKNNVLIYQHLYRSVVWATSIILCIHLNPIIFRTMVLEYGLWDQIRTDQGKEWNLLLFINEHLSNMRTDCTRPPHLQSSSKQV